MPQEEPHSRESVAQGHTPVLAEEVLFWLEPRAGVFVDCTLGAAGHAARILDGHDRALVIGIDRDPQALELAAHRLRPWADRVRLVEGVFSDLPAFLQGLGETRVDGIFADLGLSSMQLDTPERGFSFRYDAPLDMRMGRDGATAAELLNELEEVDLYEILREYGEERKARRIAREICRRRAEQPLQTTQDLVDAVTAAKGARPERPGHHPATRTFQALRIAVNKELEGLESLLDNSLELLNPNGRLVLISYHSLEDRIVKHKLRALAEVEKDEVTGRPLSERRAIEILTKKPIRPSESELATNPRARSAKLRAARRV